MKKYFYLTQYEESGMPDEFVMEILEKNKQGADREVGFGIGIVLELEL